jgi:AraC family transcriptional regulator of adaptative response/methylated-DNA-[protein]-cysteine methyltransferase
MNLTQAAMDYARVEKAIRYLDANRLRRPSLDEIARHVHLSPFHFERLFQRWAGTSPKRFLQFLTAEHAKTLLRDSRTVLDATLETGLTSPGRLHDLFVTCEAVTPGQYKQRGDGLTIRYGVHPTPFGSCVLATTDRGICALHFGPVGQLREDWPAATLVRDQRATGLLCRQIFEAGHGQFHLHLRGTNFQLKVWRALLKIPPGRLAGYGNRAVGSAVARNPIAYLIPCHRVIQSLGIIGDYRWGRTRKRAMIGWESAHTAAATRSPTSRVP